jgi:hypothetical protein
MSQGPTPGRSGPATASMTAAASQRCPGQLPCPASTEPTPSGCDDDCRYSQVTLTAARASDTAVTTSPPAAGQPLRRPGDRVAHLCDRVQECGHRQPKDDRTHGSQALVSEGRSAWRGFPPVWCLGHRISSPSELGSGLERERGLQGRRAPLAGGPFATAERLLAEGGLDLLGGHRQEWAEVAHLGLVCGHRRGDR